MGIYIHRAGPNDPNLINPNFTVVNKLMVNTRYFKLPNVVSFGQSPDFAPRDPGELRADWVQILVDAGKLPSDRRPPVKEFTHFIV